MRALDVALAKMQEGDFAGALEIAEIAQRLCPGIEHVSQIIATSQVHLAAGVSIHCIGTDWYEVLRVDRFADVAVIRKQYRRLALALHPDKNKFPGAEAAFKLIGHGMRILTDPFLRQPYDIKYRTIVDFILQKSSHESLLQRMDSQSFPPFCPNFARYEFVTTCGSCHARVQLHHQQIGRVFQCPFCRRFSFGCIQEPVASSLNHNAHFQMMNLEQYLASQRYNEPRVYAPSSNGKRGSSISQWEARKKRRKTETKAQFYDFDNLRKEQAFGVDQVWACYDPIDWMPRRYALITKIARGPAFRLQIKWLEVQPMNVGERIWQRLRLPIACGNYNFGNIQEIDNPQIFSHQVHVIRFGQHNCTVEPRKGEIWAVYKNWTKEWMLQPDRHRPPYHFDFVEILVNICHPIGLTFIYLEKVKGFSSVFRRCNRAVSPRVRVDRDDLLRFSHSIPFRRMAGTESDGIRKDYVELDPDFIYESGAGSNQIEPTEPKRVIIKVENYDFAKERTVDRLKVGEAWAIFSEKDELPREFALIEKLCFVPELRIHVSLLVRSYSPPSSRSACDLFTVERDEAMEVAMCSLSHRVGAEEIIEDVYRIVPKTGEVWAMFKEEDEFDYVEVVGWDDNMAEVVPLHQLDGGNASFYQREKGALPRQISANCFAFFSHQCCAIFHRGGQLQGLWEIDPASKPNFIVIPK